MWNCMGVPRMGVPQNHPCKHDFVQYKPSIVVIPCDETPTLLDMGAKNQLTFHHWAEVQVSILHC